MKTKFCTKCGEEKNLSEFYKNRSKKNGYNSYCKLCSKKCFEKYYEDNKEVILKQQKEYAKINEKKIAKQNKEYYKENKEKIDEQHNIYSQNNKEKISKQKKERHIKNKKIVFEYYGNKCECCGEDDFDLLTIDHKNGNGNKHRKDNKISGSTNMYNWLIKNNFPKEFQTLCRNCNCGKSHYGVCPHNKKEFEKIILKKNNKSASNKCLHKLKMDVIEGYGGGCKHCAEDNPYFLNIDHIFDDGAEERKKISHQALYRKLRDLNYSTDKYQLLCYNCNWEKKLQRKKR